MVTSNTLALHGAMRSGPGEPFVVPKGVWHRLEVLEPAHLVHITPGPELGSPPSSGRRMIGHDRDSSTSNLACAGSASEPNAETITPLRFESRTRTPSTIASSAGSLGPSNRKV
jgi:hypothetical protein